MSLSETFQSLQKNSGAVLDKMPRGTRPLVYLALLLVPILALFVPDSASFGVGLVYVLVITLCVGFLMKARRSPIGGDSLPTQEVQRRRVSARDLGDVTKATSHLKERMQAQIKDQGSVEVLNLALDGEVTGTWLEFCLTDSSIQNVTYRILALNPRSGLTHRLSDSGDPRKRHKIHVPAIFEMEKTVLALQNDPDLVRRNVSVELRYYDFPSHTHGFLIVNQELALSAVEIIDGKLAGGHLPYLLYDRHENRKSFEEAQRSYTSWFEYLWGRANVPSSPWPRREVPMVIGHRGAAGQEPENSLQGIRLALAVGADAVEVDVRVTQDGHPICIHDPSLDRTTGSKGEVRDLTLAEVQTALIPDPGGESQGLRVPTLQDVCAEILPFSAKLFIEIKDYGNWEEIVETAKNCMPADRLAFKCFNHEVIEDIRASDPDLYLVALYSGVPLFQTSGISDAGANAVSLDWSTLSEAFVESLMKQGYDVYVWTVNTPEELTRARDLGVTGIVSNYPGLAREIVDGTVEAGGLQPHKAGKTAAAPSKRAVPLERETGDD